MIQEKVDSSRQSGITDIKTNTVEKHNFMCIFNFAEDVYDSAWAQDLTKDVKFCCPADSMKYIRLCMQNDPRKGRQC